MKTVHKLSASNERLAYLGFTLSGLLFLLLAQDFSWAGINMALALIFNPFSPKSYKEFSLREKALVLTQMVVAVFCIGFNLFQVVVN